MDAKLGVTLTQTHDRKPLVTVHNLPGTDADLTPAQLRALAEALHTAANESEKQQMLGYFRRQKRTYVITPARRTNDAP